MGRWFEFNECLTDPFCTPTDLWMLEFSEGGTARVQLARVCPGEYEEALQWEELERGELRFESTTPDAEFTWGVGRVKSAVLNYEDECNAVTIAGPEGSEYERTWRLGEVRLEPVVEGDCFSQVVPVSAEDPCTADIQ